MAITREQFFSQNERRIAPSRVMAGAYLQSLTAEEMRKLKASFQTKDGNLNWKRVNRVNELLICLTVCDESGRLLFTEEHAFSADMDRVDGRITTALGAEIKEHVGWSADSDFSAIGDALKNSGGTCEERV